VQALGQVADCLKLASPMMAVSMLATFQVVQDQLRLVLVVRTVRSVRIVASLGLRKYVGMLVGGVSEKTIMRNALLLSVRYSRISTVQLCMLSVAV
jgi:hypothetical protein